MHEDLGSIFSTRKIIIIILFKKQKLGGRHAFNKNYIMVVSGTVIVNRSDVLWAISSSPQYTLRDRQ